MAESAIVIDRRYRGFEGVGQGGLTSGGLAGFLGGTARVGLRGAVPDPKRMPGRSWSSITEVGVALGLATLSAERA